MGWVDFFCDYFINEIGGRMGFIRDWKLFSKQIYRAVRNYKRPKEVVAIKSQIRDSLDSPLSSILNSYKVGSLSCSFCDTLRQIPVLNNAIVTFKMLVGDGHFECKKGKVEKELNTWREDVDVNYLLKGYSHFQRQFYDAYLTYGVVFGEMIPSILFDRIVKLKIANTADMRFMINNGELVVGQIGDNFQAVRLKDQEYILCFTHDNRNGSPIGNSLFWSVPVIAQVWDRIINSIGNTFMRIGDPSFMVTVSGGDYTLPGDIQNTIDNVSSSFEEMNKYRRRGQPTDVFVGAPPGGKVEIQMIGKEGILALESIPVQTIIDQLLAAVQLPGALLGITQARTSSYKLTDHQIQMVLARVAVYRNDYLTIKRKIINMHLALREMVGEKWRWVWNEINLLDVTQHADAELNKRKSQGIFVKMLIDLIHNKIIDKGIFTKAVIEAGIIRESEMGVFSSKNGVIDYFMVGLKNHSLKELLEDLGVK